MNQSLEEAHTVDSDWGGRKEREKRFDVQVLDHFVYLSTYKFEGCGSPVLTGTCTCMYIYRSCIMWYIARPIANHCSQMKSPLNSYTHNVHI